MAYGFAKQNNEEKTDNGLMCTAHGCPMKWSVQVESRLCSYHAWESPYNWPSITSRLINDGAWKLENHEVPSLESYLGDRLGWAKRLRDRNDSGEKLNLNQIRCFKEALGIKQ